MPGFDGTGPQGQGSLTGGGRGFCAMPLSYNPGVPYGISGMQNNPVNVSYSYPPNYGGSYGPLYQYPSYPGRSSGYFGRSAGYFRGRGGGRSFFRGTGMRGIGIRGRGRRF